MKLSKRQFALCLTSAALLMAGGAHAQNALDDVMKAKKIKQDELGTELIG